MRYLGLDVGTKTLGVAVSDPTNQFSSPLTTIHYEENDFTSSIPKLKEIIAEKNITDIVIGLPKNMNNTLGFAAQRSLEFQEMLKKHFTIPIYLVDERLSTIEAEKILIATNHSRQKRKKVIDNVAAAILLDTFLRERKGLNAAK